MTTIWFVKCEANGCLLIRLNDVETVILCIYVDKILVVGDKEEVGALKQEIVQFFNTKRKGQWKNTLDAG